MASESRNVVKQDAVGAGNGGTGLDEGCLDFMVVVQWREMSLIPGVVQTLTYQSC